MTGVAGALAVSAVAVGSFLASTSLTDTDDTIQPAPEPPVSDSQIVDACRQAPEQEPGIAAMYDPGLPSVVTSAVSGFEVVAVLESADGAYWADCAVARVRQEFSATMSVWDAAGPATTGLGLRASVGYGPGCPPTETLDTDENCGTFHVSWVDRLPDPVAAVRFDLTGGQDVTVEAVDGFVLLNHVGPLPDGVDMTSSGLPDDFAPLTRITYLDAAGTELAALALDDFSGTVSQPVDGLPSLDTYPPLRGDEVS
jgi:hypothetical protein